MELHATMALDRDAVNTLTLRLLPPSTATTSTTAWLLLHTIPITASLSRTLSRLLSIEEAAMALGADGGTDAPATPSTTAATAPLTVHAHDAPLPPAVLRAADTGGSGGVSSSSNIRTASATRRSASRRIHERAQSSSSLSDSELSPRTGACADHKEETKETATTATTANVTATAAAAAAMAPAAGWLECVRVGYVLSEIHAYCILMKCHTPAQAVRMKEALEEGAALGVTAPVEFVSDAQPVVVTRRVFAEAAAVPTADGGASPSSSPASSPHHGNSRGGELSVGGAERDPAASLTDPTASIHPQQQRWHSEVHMVPLLEAVTTVFPVRDNDAFESADSSYHHGHTGSASAGHHRFSSQLQQQQRAEASGRWGTSGSGVSSQLQSPSPQRLRRPHSDHALSAPSSPALHQQPLRQSPLPVTNTTAPSTPPVAGAGRGRGGYPSKGAAPPPSLSFRAATAAGTTASAAASTPMMGGGASALRASPAAAAVAAVAAAGLSSHAHTPLQLPHPCSEGGVTPPLLLDGLLHAASTPASGTPAAAAAVGPYSVSGTLRETDAVVASAAAATPLCPGSSSIYAARDTLGDEYCAICQVDPLRSAACVTTLCQHAFHLQCYAQLPSSSAECPLCRFSVYDLLNDARCETCGTYEDLWVCLICGHVACGRARRDHQQEHYRSSGHTCSWQSSTNRIWNLSSRMFLHQEVALLLDGEDDEEGGSRRGAPAAAASSSSCAASWAQGDDGSSGTHRLCAAFSWAEPLDADLQEALNESKEEAVANYYTAFLQQLAEEQRAYYERQLAGLRGRRERQQGEKTRREATAAPLHDSDRPSSNRSGLPSQGGGAEVRDSPERQSPSSGRHHEAVVTDEGGSVHATTADAARRAAVVGESPGPSLAAALHALGRDERRQRRRLLAEYATSTVELLQQAQRAYTHFYSSLKATRDDAQQQVLLRSHFNNGVVAQLEQVRLRTQETVRKGERNAQMKSAEEAELQKRVEAALSAL